MRKTALSVLAAIGVFAAIGSASAADIPSFKAPPIFASDEARLPYFVGVNGGTVTNTKSGTIGASAGVDFGYVRAEGLYRNVGLGSKSSNDLIANAIIQYPFGNLEPYAFGGLGYEWRQVGANAAVWDTGLGARYALTKNIALDARYTFVQSFEHTKTPENLFTIGAEYRF